MIKFIIELDVDKGVFDAKELNQIEYLIEKTLDGWGSQLPESLGMEVITEKVKNFWEKGCYLRVSAS